MSLFSPIRAWLFSMVFFLRYASKTNPIFSIYIYNNNNHKEYVKPLPVSLPLITSTLLTSLGEREREKKRHIHTYRSVVYADSPFSWTMKLATRAQVCVCVCNPYKGMINHWSPKCDLNREENSVYTFTHLYGDVTLSHQYYVWNAFDLCFKRVGRDPFFLSLPLQSSIQMKLFIYVECFCFDYFVGDWITIDK